MPGPSLSSNVTGSPRIPAARIFLFVAGALSSTILLKLASIQYLEIIYFFQLLLLIFFAFPRNGFRFTLTRPSFALAIQFSIFLAIALLLALVAYQNDFYIPLDSGLLRQPLWITLSRATEFAIDAGAMIYLIQVFSIDFNNMIFAMKVYYWVGVLSAVYSILTYPLAVLGIAELGTYSISFRMRGFYNEGGPYGMYVVSIIFVGITLYSERWDNRRRLLASSPLILIALLGSQSKASMFAIGCVLLISALVLPGVGRRLILLSLLGVIVVGVNSVTDIGSQLRAYQRGSTTYEASSYLHSADGNYVYGRVAGAFIVPRMIAARPVLGIGWGNYGIVRNDPAYRGGSVWVYSADEPGLGVLGIAAELGIPLTLYLMLIFFFPLFYARRVKAPFFIQNLAILHPISCLFGSPLNFTYPWLVTAFAIAICHHYSQRHALPPAPDAA